MDQLNDAPIQVKALVILVFAGLIFAVFYFMLLEEVRGSITSAQNAKKKAEDEVLTLKRYEDTSQLKQLKLKEEQLKKRLKANKERLPTEEKIADLFEAMARRAETQGLELGTRTKLPPEYEDYVKKVPIKMTVKGTFPAVIKYFRSLTGNDMRLVTLSSLHIKQLSFTDVMPEVEKQRRITRRDQFGRPAVSEEVSAARELVSKLDAYDEGRPRARVQADFVVTAYSYTGKLAPAGKKKRRKRRRRRRR